MTVSEFLAESKRIEAEATAGLWVALRHDERFSAIAVADGSRYITGGADFTEEPDLLVSDAEFIAHARTALPRMREALEAVAAVFPGFGEDPCPPKTCVHVDCEVYNAIESALAENGGKNDA